MTDTRKISNNEKKLAMNELLRFVTACPQIIKPGIGLPEFVEDLNKAAVKFAEYTEVDIHESFAQKPN